MCCRVILLLLVFNFATNGFAGFEFGGWRQTASTKQTPQTTASVKSGPQDSFIDRSIEESLWWLPEDTEVVSAVRGPFKVPDALKIDERSMSTLDLMDLGLKSLPLKLLGLIREGYFYKRIAGRNVAYCLEGSRKFREPKSLGAMLYEGCHIIAFEDDESPQLLFRQLPDRLGKHQMVAGHDVVFFEEKTEDDFIKVYLCSPSPRIVLCATNLDYLTVVMTRMKQRAGRRALPTDLPEWKLVDTQSRFWSLRHYDKSDAADDPTSPLSGNQMGANWIDPRAVGVTFSLDPKRSSVATVRYLSTNPDALKLFTSEQKSIKEDYEPILRQNSSGAVELLVSLDGERNQIFLLVLLSLFGHGVFL